MKPPYLSLLRIPLWHHMSISSTGESDATRWKLLLLVPVYSTDHPRGLLLLLTTPPPRLLVPLILISYITHLFRSHNQLKASCMEHRVHFDCIVHLCNKIKPSPFLPDLRRTLRLIQKSVSSQHSWFFKTNVTVCFLSHRSSLTCPHCLKQSNTFDPFLCISLPIPLRQTR